MTIETSTNTCSQPDTKTNPNLNPNPNHNPTSKRHAVVHIQLNIVAGHTHPEKLRRDNVVAPFLPTSVVTVTLPIKWYIRFAPSCTSRRWTMLSTLHRAV